MVPQTCTWLFNLLRILFFVHGKSKTGGRNKRPCPGEEKHICVGSFRRRLVVLSSIPGPLAQWTTLLLRPFVGDQRTVVRMNTFPMDVSGVVVPGAEVGARCVFVFG